MNRKTNIESRIAEYKRLCNLGMTRLEIANKMNVTVRQTYEYQRLSGVSVKITYDYQDNLKKYKELCLLGKNASEISNILHVTIKSVHNYEHATGIKPAPPIGRIANIDTHYFNNIDTEEKAYILGFLGADGYVDCACKSVILNINKKDEDILRKIKDELKCKTPYSKSSTQNCIRLNMSSIEIVSDLKKYNIVPHKSRTYAMPVLKEDLYRHFFRGYCDGDGHVGYKQVVIAIGSDVFFHEMVSYIEKLFNKKLSTRTTGNCHYIVLSRKDLDIVLWMYSDARIYLDRKMKSFVCNWVSYAEKRRSRG